MITLTIVGYGNVGKAISLLLLGSSREVHINILDPAENKKGIFLDLNHAAMAHKNKTVTINESDLLCRSDFIFFTAGVPNKAGGSRLEKIEENKALVREVFDTVELKSSVKIIAITNPIDIITLEILKTTKLPWNLVVGTGTYLDSLRFQYHLAEKAMIDFHNLKTVVLGEHGETQVPIPSLCTFEGKPIENRKEFSEGVISEASLATKNAATEIRKTEAGTSLGVGQCAVKIMECWLDENPVEIPLSILLNDTYKNAFHVEKDLCISIPVVISKKGIRILDVPNFTEKEKDGLQKSIDAMLSLV